MNTKTLVGVVVLLLVLGVLGYFFMGNTEDHQVDDSDRRMMDGETMDEMNDMRGEMLDMMNNASSEEEMEASESAEASVSSSAETTTEAEVETPSEPETLEVTVEGENYTYNPSSITVKQGQKVRLTFKSTGGFHDFVIDEIEGAQSARVSGGEETVIEFTPTKTGSFTYYCSVGSHRALGMEGTLIVKPN